MLANKTEAEPTADEHKADTGRQFKMEQYILHGGGPLGTAQADITPRGKHHFDLKPDQGVLLEEGVKGL